MVKVRGVWTPLVNYNALTLEVLVGVIARKSARLTGNEIRFIRQHSEMTLGAFGTRFDVSHAAVLKWERAGELPPALKWPIEKDIRLFILDRLRVRPTAFKELYESPRHETKATSRPLEMG